MRKIYGLDTFNIYNYMFPKNNRALHLTDFTLEMNFFYCLSPPNIQCAFWRIIFGDIEDGEIDIIDRHERFSHNCSFVRGDKHNNIPLIAQSSFEMPDNPIWLQEVGRNPPLPSPLLLDDDVLMAFIEEMSNQVVGEIEAPTLPPEVQSIIETLQPM